MGLEPGGSRMANESEPRGRAPRTDGGRGDPWGEEGDPWKEGTSYLNRPCPVCGEPITTREEAELHIEKCLTEDEEESGE